MSGLLQRHLGFVHALRDAGLSVSLAEDLDGLRALELVGLADRRILRETYAATLVKRPSHRSSFDALFDLFFPAILGEGAEAEWVEEPVAEQDSAQALSQFRAELTEALAEGDQEAQALLAREGVGRFGAMRGRGPGMARWSAYNTLQRTSPEGLILKITEALVNGVLDQAPMSNDRALRTAAQRVEGFEQLVEAEARRRMAEDRSPEYVANATLRPTIDQIAFLGARKGDLEQMRKEIYPLARRLATKLTKSQHSAQRGPLDFRRTVRASISTGGVPLETVHKPKRPHRTELVVLCDVSGSVSTFAQFTLTLVYALRDQFTKVRAFTFVDDVHEVTSVFQPGGDVVKTMEELAASIQYASLWGRTNYGRAFSKFVELHSDALGPKTSLLVLGDARSNYADLNLDAVRRISRDTRHAWWLNPEHTRQWDTGDSAASAYAAHIPMVECRNLTQLGEFVHRIL